MPTKKQTDLEKALEEQAKNSDKPQQPAMSKEQEIGYHQGALNTLVNERNELIKMAQIGEKIMQMHLQRLEQLGVNRRGPPVEDLAV